MAVGAALVLALATFLIFAGLHADHSDRDVVLHVLFAATALSSSCSIVLIAWSCCSLRAARRAARAGARLHSRFVALFSLVAAIPALVTAIVAPSRWNGRSIRAS